MAPTVPGSWGAHLLSGAVCKNRSQLQPRFGLLRPHYPARWVQGSATVQEREAVRVRHWGHMAPRGKLWFHPGGKPGFQELPAHSKGCCRCPSCLTLVTGEVMRMKAEALGRYSG